QTFKVCGQKLNVEQSGLSADTGCLGDQAASQIAQHAGHGMIGVFDPNQIRAQAEEIYNTEVAAVLPHSDEMMALQSDGIFSLEYPNHPMSGMLRDLASSLVS
ncbi:MAG: hypothetical protein AAF614_23730, partial [Chloroflexota bacterium]